MRLDITFRQIDASDEIRQWVERRVGKVDRFLRPPIEVHVVVREEKHRQIAEVTVNAAGEGPYVASAESEDIRTSIDLVMQKIESSVRRAHDRRVDHRRHQVSDDQPPV